MLIKQRSFEYSLPGFLGAGAIRGGRRWRILYRGTLVLAGLVLLVVLSAGLYDIGKNPRKYLLYARAGVASVWNWVGSHSTSPRAVNISIKFTDYQRLAYDRDQALVRGWIEQHDDSFVPAKVELANRTADVKIRLKGDKTDHVEGDKWSFRIRVKGDDAVYGMRTFSIQNPKRSKFVYEWLFHEFVRHEGLVAPRYDFIDVSINGTSKGIHAMEESFGKEMLEAHDRREGPIVRFNEDFLWKGLPIFELQSDVFFAAEVDAFSSKKTSADPGLRRQYEMARKLLEDFRDKNVPVDRVFDLDKAATCFAIADLFSAKHAVRWKNIRFYYNPVTSLLEPIPYNAYGNSGVVTADIKPNTYFQGRLKYGWFHLHEWMDAFFKDPAFYRAYVRELDRISNPRFLEKFFRDVDEELQEKLRIIHSDSPAFVYSNESILINARTIRAAVRPALPVRARFDPEEQGGRSSLSVANSVWLTIELIAVVDTATEVTHSFPEPMRVAPKQGDILQDIRIPLPLSARDSFADFADDKFVLTYRVMGMSDVHSASISGHPSVGENLAQRLAQGSSKLRGWEAAEVEDSDRTITLLAGNWVLEESMHIPGGYVVVIGPGVVVDLRNGASLISYSPLRAEGTAEQPAVFRSSDRSGGGVVLMTTGGESILRHVRCEGLSSPVEGSWTTTGAFTAYESPVRILDCRFSAGRSEDLVNIVRSRFSIERSEFTQTPFDALDVDFGEGSIRECTFLDIGNDAIDISGTSLTLANCLSRNIGDKGLSVGEASSAHAEDVDIQDCRFGIVSKDLSTLVARNVKIRNAAIALAVYQKKPEYGPASMALEDLRIDETPEPYLIERGSWAEVDGQRIGGASVDVAATLYGEE